MPELAELKLSAQYINESCKDKIFDNIKKNPVHKGHEVHPPLDATVYSDRVRIEFTIKAESRGKEMLLHINDSTLKFTFGMSGHFKMTKTGEERKHSHLMFYTKDGYTLSFVDVRRFGKWKWDTWGKARGFDPTTDYKDFCKDIQENLHQRAFDRPIGEALLNQRYFNGIGNYLRAEILYKADQNPFESARDAITNNPKILEYCNSIPLEAFVLGGGQLKQWENPFGVEPDRFTKWMKCYGNQGMKTIRDRNGRRLWFDPKWEQHNELHI